MGNRRREARRKQGKMKGHGRKERCRKEKRESKMKTHRREARCRREKKREGRMRTHGREKREGRMRTHRREKREGRMRPHRREERCRRKWKKRQSGEGVMLVAVRSLLLHQTVQRRRGRWKLIS